MVEQSWSRRVEEPLEPAPPEAMVVPPVRGAAQARLAARVTAACGGLLLVAVAVHVLKTVKGLARR